MKHARTIIALATFSTAVALSASARADGWAAIANNGHGSWGYAVGKASSAEAASIAVSECGSPNCKASAVKQAHCIAYVLGQGTVGYGMGPNPVAATSNATEFCELGKQPGYCHVVKAACE